MSYYIHVPLPELKYARPWVLGEGTRFEAGIPSRYWEDVRFQDIPDVLMHKHELHDWIKSQHLWHKHGRGLVLLGKVGTGKTSGGVIVLRNILSRGCSAFFTTASNLANNLASRNPAPLPNGCSYKKGIKTVQYLQIDDLGTEDEAQWKQTEILSVISDRYDAKLSTIITANILPEDFRQKSERVADRFKETAEVITFEKVRWRIPQGSDKACPLVHPSL